MTTLYVNKRIQSMRGDTQQRPGPGDGLGLFSLLKVSCRLASLGSDEFSLGGGGGDLRGGNGSASEDGYDVIADLGEPTIDKVTLGRRTNARP